MSSTPWIRAPGRTTFPCPLIHLSRFVWQCSETRVSPGPLWTTPWQSISERKVLLSSSRASEGSNWCPTGLSYKKRRLHESRNFVSKDIWSYCLLCYALLATVWSIVQASVPCIQRLCCSYAPVLLFWAHWEAETMSFLQTEKKESQVSVPFNYRQVDTWWSIVSCCFWMPGGSRSSAPAQHCSYFKTKQITDSVIEKECPQDAALAGLPSLILPNPSFQPQFPQSRV